MKKTALIAGLTGVLLPMSFAFADAQAPVPQGGIGLGAAAHVNFRADASETLPQIIRARIGIGANASTSMHTPHNWRNATGTPSTTPAWKQKPGNATSTQHRMNASTSANSSMGLHLGEIKGFLNWLFQLPTSTTVGDIRADITASTTALTSASTSAPMHPQSFVGVFARFFAGFGAFFGAH